MRFILLGSVALVGLAATPTLAADWTGFYAGVYGGASTRNSTNIDLTYVTGAINLEAGSVDPGVYNINNIDPTAFDILERAATGWQFLGVGDADAYIANSDLTYDLGLTLGGVLGYSAGNGWRFEGDLSVHNFGSAMLGVADALHQDVHGDVNNGGSYDWTKVSENAVPGSLLPIDISGYAAFFLTDAWFDFDNDTSFTPYLGGGAGLALVNTVFNDMSTATFSLAGQVGAGVRVDLNDTSFLDFGYRYKVAGNGGGASSGYSDEVVDTTYNFEGYQMSEQGPLTVQTLQLGYNLIIK